MYLYILNAQKPIHGIHLSVDDDAKNFNLEPKPFPNDYEHMDTVEMVVRETVSHLKEKASSYTEALVTLVGILSMFNAKGLDFVALEDKVVDNEDLNLFEEG